MRLDASAHYRPATRWCLPHSQLQELWQREPDARGARRAALCLPRAAGRSRQEVLLDLLQESLARGHWKLALRRYLMLLACDCEVPAAQRTVCERHLRKCPPRGLRKMEEDVRAWSRCIA